MAICLPCSRGLYRNVKFLLFTIFVFGVLQGCEKESEDNIIFYDDDRAYRVVNELEKHGIDYRKTKKNVIWYSSRDRDDVKEILNNISDNTPEKYEFYRQEYRDVFVKLLVESQIEFEEENGENGVYVILVEDKFRDRANEVFDEFITLFVKE